MSRKKLDEGGVGDALELLIDPISNLFGCVLFIALLVALMTSASSTAVANGTAKVDPSIPRAELVRVRAAAKVGELERTLAALEDVNQTLSVEGVGDMAQVGDKLEKNIAGLRQRLEARSQSLAEMKRNPDSPTADLERQVRNMEKEIAASALEIEQLRKSRVIEAKLPVLERMIGKQQHILVFKNGEAYYFTTEHHRNPIEGLTVVPHRERAIGGNLISDELQLTPGTGISGDSLRDASSTPMRAMLVATQSDSGFFDVWVCQDSVAAFRDFKQIMEENNRRIGVNTVGLNDPIRFSFTDDARSAQ